MPRSERIAWLVRLKSVAGEARVRLWAEQAIRRIRRAGKGAKYPIFYGLQKLIDFAFPGDDPSSLSMADLLDRLIIQLRLTTMMRSTDAAHIVWVIFTHDGSHFVQLTDKNGALQTFSVASETLVTLKEYLRRHVSYPNVFLLRYEKRPEQVLQSERVAKRALQVMQRVGIDVRIFKAHSLRGATATHLMEHGMSRNLVQARGCWKSSTTLDEYYDRLHQRTDWRQALMGGNARLEAMPACAGPTPTAPLPGADGGRRTGGTRRKARHKTAFSTPIQCFAPSTANKVARHVRKRVPVKPPTHVKHVTPSIMCAACSGHRAKVLPRHFSHVQKSWRLRMTRKFALTGLSVGVWEFHVGSRTLRTPWGVCAPF